jgi:hypothetical protein
MVPVPQFQGLEHPVHHCALTPENQQVAPYLDALVAALLVVHQVDARTGTVVFTGCVHRGQEVAGALGCAELCPSPLVCSTRMRLDLRLISRRRPLRLAALDRASDGGQCTGDEGSARHCRPRRPCCLSMGRRDAVYRRAARGRAQLGGLGVGIRALCGAGERRGGLRGRGSSPQPRAAGSWSPAAASTSGTWASAASKRLRVPRAARVAR